MKLRNLLMACIATVTMLFPVCATAGPEYSGAALAFPSDCRDRLRNNGGDLSCKLHFGEGNSIKIDLVFHKLTIGAFARDLGATRKKVLANPRGYMRAALKHYEKLAVKARDSGRGKVQIIEQSMQAKPASRAQKGLDECLYFMEDVNVSEWSGEYLARVDLSGVRCLGMDTERDRVWYTYVEIGAVHKKETKRRLPSFDAYAAKILKSVRLQE